MNWTQRRGRLLVSTALIVGALAPAVAQAQDEPRVGLEEIVVTAQKREQSLQDVPIAVTAVTEESLQANRIMTVNDLSAIAPGVTVRPSAGGIQTPFFTMRGSVSTGVVAGQDKTVSIYLDGVYISSPRGSIFDLPDVQRLEVLRGPQGTLFGRNATGGAISVTTRDPTGDARVKLEGSVGNYNSNRLRATVETPEVGPLSGLFSYVRNYRRGEIRNLMPGLVWDRSLSPSPVGKSASARWLGTVNTDSYFAAVKLQASDSIKLVYKYDRNDDRGTPEGTSAIAYNKGIPLFGNVLTALLTSNNVPLNPSAKRPDAVSNGFAIPRQQRVQGHSVTATWDVADGITVKNIAAYRKANVFSPSPIDGVSSLTFTQATLVPFATLSAFSASPALAQAPAVVQGATIQAYAGALAPLIGQRAILIASQAGSIAKQWSDELQVNYTSDRLNVTLGAMWFHSKDESGGPVGMQNTLLPVKFVPASGLMPLGNEGRSFNKATSLAAYLQVEYKLTDQLEVVAGGRITQDKKSSALRYDIVNSQGVTTRPSTTIRPTPYKKSKPNYLIGLNWKPNDETLVYAKHSTSFVSGGTTYGIDYAPETAKSYELGAKLDLFDRRLRTNLALYHVDYKHLQQSQGTSVPSSFGICSQALTGQFGSAQANELCSVISTYVFDVGSLRSKGLELEVTAAPTDGLLLGGSVGYSDTKYTYIKPVVVQNNGGTYLVTSRPKWTGSAYVSYETQPLFGETTANFRIDGLYQSRNQVQSQSRATFLYADGSNAGAYDVPGYWTFNGRVALKHLQLAGTNAELSLWGKNLTNRKDMSYSLSMGLTTSGNFIPPRTWGVELGVEF